MDISFVWYLDLIDISSPRVFLGTTLACCQIDSITINLTPPSFGEISQVELVEVC